ncbi:MAG: peptide chain release factor-like protein [bacterium]|nr:peptide chain release factor-like protein [bacterium]
MKKEHLFSVTKKDFEFQTFRSGGPGGQHQNKTDSGVRIIHKASGAVGESRTDKSQHRNKKLALQRLTKSKKFKLWVSQKAYEITGGKTIEERVEEAMVEGSIKTEIKNEKGRWVKHE